MNKLVICNSENLPAMNDRTNDTIYFVYDKMAIFLGQSFYSDPFCIVEEIPEHPVPAMLYITFTGDVKAYVNDQVTIIAQIEDDTQLQYLNSAGSIYFMKAEYRYLDLQTRVVHLPYQNGEFQLTVNLAKEIMINENTVLRYNPITSQFEIEGDWYEDEGHIPNSAGYTGGETTSTITTFNEKTFLTDVKISQEVNNVLKVFGNGLYVDISTKANKNDFNDLVNSYIEYKSIIDGYIIELKDAIEDASIEVSEGTIGEKINQALEEYKPSILDMIDKYDQMYSQLQELQKLYDSGVDEAFNETKKEITDYLNDITNAWGYFPGEPSTGDDGTEEDQTTTGDETTGTTNDESSSG